MIIVYHQNNKVVKVYDYENNKDVSFIRNKIQNTLISIANKNRSKFICWCHNSYKIDLNVNEFKAFLKHQLIMVSFETSKNFYINSSIGFVEDSPFINVNKNCNYPTWLMSSDVGGLHASVILKFTPLLKYKLSFSYFLNSVSKIGMKHGLLCYSNPYLLKRNFSSKIFCKTDISKTEMLRFIKSNYRYRWQFIYLLNTLLYQKKFYLWSFFKSLFKSKITCNINFRDIKIENNEPYLKPSIDVLIPTLGRSDCLKNVLIDLSKQTLLPTKVIIVEQDKTKEDSSELKFLSEKWPFEIDHTLIHQLGACNARNIALKKVTSDWVFFADDDIRLNNKFLEEAFGYINSYGANAVTISCLQKNEIEKKEDIFQSPVFGSGTSIINSNSVKDIKFNMAYEFGYSEDADFGMQLRNNGIDILYIPFVSMLHLKAPIGGFRMQIKKLWDLEVVKPKPSPTVMVYKLKHATKEQLQSYKTTLFLKFYKNQSIKNPLSYFRMMKKSWDKSIYWANILINKY